jgi:pimeloyl-ACP methyl ester carboxylesterase
MPRSLGAALAAAFLAFPAAAPAATSTRPCPEVDGFSCTRIDVPLDRTGTVAGTLSLRFATEQGVRTKKKVLLALTGGPGQPGVLFGPSYADAFAEQLDDYSLVVLDQRGTGGSRALSCPEIQGIDSVAPIFPQDVAGCAERLGEQRNSFASIDTADDIEAVRKKLGVEKIAIYGVSYGTWVAQQYARAYPDRVDRLILDSVVSPQGDPWDTQITRALPRVLEAICGKTRCRGITADPMADLTAVVKRIQRDGRLRGVVRTPTGGREPVELSQTDLLYILVASDLNPYLQSRVPAALVAARRGDTAPLLRLKKDAGGPPSPLSEFSGGLFVSTTCLDNELPYSYGDSFDERAAKSTAALAALPESSITPFDRPAVDSSSVAQICLHWPDGVYRPESTAPMPAVPTLILSGLTDTRTPLEGARELAAEIDGESLVTLAGGGHDLLDTDYTGCVATAIRRFFRDRAVGTPCKGKSVAPRLTLVPPRSLDAVAPVPGLPGRRAKVLRAAVSTLADASTSDNQSYYAGFQDTSGGGLRGGAFEVIPTGRGQVLVMRRLEYVPHVWLTGAVLVDGNRAVGSAKVTAPDGLGGHVVFFGTKVVGRLGGKTLKTTIAHLSKTRLARTTRSAPRTVLRVAPR